MSEQGQKPRFSMIEIASSDDLRRGLEYTLRNQGYGFNTKFPPSDGPIDFEAWKSDDPENTRVIIIISAGTADKETIAEALTHLGWYREQQKKPNTRAWVIAKSFTQAARYAAEVCSDLTLKSYEVEISLLDGYRIAS
jgi:hypothetical protein